MNWKGCDRLMYGRVVIVVLAVFAALFSEARTSYETLDLSPLKKAGAFGDAVWKDELREKSEFAFFGVPFKLMAPERTADPSFALALKPATYAEAAVLFCVDEANATAVPFVTLRLTAGGKTGDVHIDLRTGDGPTVAPEVGRILRGPSGTLHYPVRFARIPLHPDAVAAAESGKGPMTLQFLAPAGRTSAFTVAAVTMIAKTPLREAKDGFTLSFDVDVGTTPREEPLYEAEGALKVRVRDAKKNPAPGNYDELNGNVYNFPLPDGSCPVIEALLPGPTGRLGIPLGALKQPFGKHRVRIVFNGTYFTLDVDERRDEDFPYEPLLWPDGDKGAALSPRVTNLAFAFGAPKGPVAREGALQKGFAAMYWNPEDHNRWLGDVVTTTWDGRLHVFYLADRRHHNSKGGRGGHWFEHIVSDDLVHWEELPAAVPMDECTEYIGTGTPFQMDGKYCLAYGLHTTRHCSEAEVKRRGLPFGGTYSTSSDGIHFTKSHEIITADQNPSVYNRADGLFGMGCLDHLEKSASIHGPWETVVSNAHVFGDCPCPFEWNGWHYIVQGFCTMAMSKTGENGSYTDEVLSGSDVYEGLSVPMVAPWKGNRRLLIGWINHGYGWGGWLCFRELVQYPDGHLGTKWVPEIPMPTPVKTYRVRPGEEFNLEFTGTGDTFAFTLDWAERKAWFSTRQADGTYRKIPTLGEMAVENEKKWGARRICAGRKYRPDDGNDFAIGNILGLDKPFEVKVENHFDKKSGFTLLDIEIAGQRTMVTRRHGRFAVDANGRD